MISKIKSVLPLLNRKLSNGIKRFPEAIGFAAATVGLLIVINHRQAPEETIKLLTRMAMVLALGFPITLSLRVFWEHHIKQRGKFVITIFPLTLAALIIYLSFALKELSPIAVSRYLAYSLACYLAFLFIPYLTNHKDFELYVLDLFTKFCATYLYAATLYLGLLAILFTIDQLFGVQINDKLYLDFWLIIAGLLAPIYFLAEIPKHSRTYEPEHYPNVLKVLFVYILIPLFSVYTIILYAYFAKIISTQTWPIGLVGHLVLWYAAFSAVVIFCLYPIRKQNWLAEKFLTLFPWLILPLIGMMFVAMGKRIEAYGITENRYYVLIAGLWVTGWMLYYCFGKHPRNVLLPFSLAIIAVLAVTGPWSSFTVAKNSQRQRLLTLLDKYELLEDNTIIPRPNLSAKAKGEICSIIAYFHDNHSMKEIRILPHDFTTNDMEDVFGFKFTRRSALGKDGREFYAYQSTEEDRLLSLDGYAVFADLTGIYKEKTLCQKGLYDITYSGQEKMLVIAEDGRELYRKNMADLLKNVPKAEDPASESAQIPIITDQNEQLIVRYLFKQVHGWKDPYSKEFEVDWAEFYLFIGER